MAKRIDGKNRKQPNGAASLKSDKLKLDAHERQTEKNRLREQKHLQLKKNEELKVLEYQVILCVHYILLAFIIFTFL